MTQQFEIGSLQPQQNEQSLDLSKIENTLGFLIRTLQQRSFKAFHAEFGGIGLTPARHAILTMIGSNPGVKQVQLASVLGLHEPNMALLVKECEKGELVHRSRSKKDGRAISLTLTDKGKAFLAEIETRSAVVDRQTVQLLTDIETTLLTQLLIKAVGPFSRNDEAVGQDDL